MSVARAQPARALDPLIRSIPTAWFWGLACWAAMAACHSDAPVPPSYSVTDHIGGTAPVQAVEAAHTPAGTVHTMPTAEPPGVVARVGQQSITRSAFQRMLERSHGLFVIEQLIAAELVDQEAQRRKVSVTDAEVQAELNQALRDMAQPVAGPNSADLLVVGQRMLEMLLVEKNISRDQFMLSMRRNALLRKMVSPEVEITNDEVIAEFHRRFGRRVQVRHIALPDMAAVADIRRRLAAGEDFIRLAERYSIDRDSAAGGGLLRHFARDDPSVPQVMRDAAFALQPGQISGTLRIDRTYHLLRCEDIQEPSGGPLTPDLAESLQNSLRDAEIRTRMQTLERQLFDDADIRILDETLRQKFQQKHAASH